MSGNICLQKCDLMDINIKQPNICECLSLMPILINFSILELKVCPIIRLNSVTQNHYRLRSRLCLTNNRLNMSTEAEDKDTRVS
jgi:hypothetical protein